MILHDSLQLPSYVWQAWLEYEVLCFPRHPLNSTTAGAQVPLLQVPFASCGALCAEAQFNASCSYLIGACAKYVTEVSR